MACTLRVLWGVHGDAEKALGVLPKYQIAGESFVGKAGRLAANLSGFEPVLVDLQASYPRLKRRAWNSEFSGRPTWT